MTMHPHLPLIVKSFSLTGKAAIFSAKTVDLSRVTTVASHFFRNDVKSFVHDRPRALADDNFIRTDQPKNISRPFVEKVEVKIAIRKPFCEVPKALDLGPEMISFDLPNIDFSFNLNAAKYAKRPLNGRMEKVERQHCHQQKEEGGAKVEPLPHLTLPSYECCHFVMSPSTLELGILFIRPIVAKRETRDWTFATAGDFCQKDGGECMS